MHRPTGKVEKWIQAIPAIIYFFIVAALALLSFKLSPHSDAGAAVWLVVLCIVLVIVRWAICAISHRLEFPSWYAKVHVREGDMRLNAKANRFEMGASKCYSYNQLWRSKVSR
jgi:protein-S-isoprenylcysteine O-methyltransferase Ste14